MTYVIQVIRAILEKGFRTEPDMVPTCNIKGFARTGENDIDAGPSEQIYRSEGFHFFDSVDKENDGAGHVGIFTSFRAVLAKRKRCLSGIPFSEAAQEAPNAVRVGGAVVLDEVVVSASLERSKEFRLGSGGEERFPVLKRNGPVASPVQQ